MLRIWDVRLDEPMGEWRKTWERVRTTAFSAPVKKAPGESPSSPKEAAEDRARRGVNYRWHDPRHTFVTRLAENPNVSEETIRALAGHVSRRMLERYSHIRTRAKEDAIRTLEQHEIRGDGAQNWAQSEVAEKPTLPN